MRVVVLQYSPGKEDRWDCYGEDSSEVRQTMLLAGKRLRTGARESEVSELATASTWGGLPQYRFGACEGRSQRQDTLMCLCCVHDVAWVLTEGYFAA